MPLISDNEDLIALDILWWRCNISNVTNNYRLEIKLDKYVNFINVSKRQSFASATFPYTKCFEILYTFIQPSFQTGAGNNTTY